MKYGIIARKPDEDNFKIIVSGVKFGRVTFWDYDKAATLRTIGELEKQFPERQFMLIEKD